MKRKFQKHCGWEQFLYNKKKQEQNVAYMKIDNAVKLNKIKN